MSSRWMGSHARAFLSSIAELVAKSEFKDTRTIKSELLEAISLSIARSVARAIFRRRKTYEFTFNLAQGRIASELAALTDEEGED